MAVELATAYVSIVPSTQGLGPALAKSLGDAGLETTGTKAGEGAGDGFLSGFGGKAMAGAAGVGLAVGAVLVKGFGDAIDQGATSDKLAAQLGLSEADSALYGSIAGDLYADAYGDSFGEVSGAIGSVVSTLGDLDPAQVEDLTAKALDLASAFDIDVESSVSAAGQLLRSGLATDADHAFDLITAGFQEMPSAMREELLEASNEYGKFFSGLGITGEEAFGILAAASEDGMYGIDKTGDALKELTIRATDMSASSVAAYEAAGLSAEDMAGRFLAGGDEAGAAFDDLVSGLLAIEDPVERANASIALFGTPLEDLGVQGIPDFLGSLQTMENGLGDVSGAAEAMGDTLNDNAATKIEGFKRKGFQALTEFIGGSVIPGIESVVEWLGPRLSAGIATVTPWLQQAGTWLLGLWESAQPFVEGVRTHVIPVLEELRATMLEALGNVVAWVQENWPAIRDTIVAVIDRTREAVEVGLAIVSWLWESVGASVLGFVTSVWGGIREVIGGVMQVIAGIISTVMALIRGDWGAAWDGIKQIVGGVFDTIRGIIGTALGVIWGILGGIVGILDDTIGRGFRAIVGVVSRAIDDVVGFITGLPGRVRDVGSSIASAIGDGFRSAWNAVAGRINDLIPNDIKIDTPVGSYGFDLPDNPLPTFHRGGIVPGRPGEEVLAVLEAGERVFSRRQVAASDALDPAALSRGATFRGTILVDGKTFGDVVAVETRDHRRTRS